MAEQIKKVISKAEGINGVGNIVGMFRDTPQPKKLFGDKVTYYVYKLNSAVYLRMAVITAMSGYITATYKEFINLSWRDEKFQTIVFVYLLMAVLFAILSHQISGELKTLLKMYQKERDKQIKWLTVKDILKDKVNTPFELLAYVAVVLDDEGLLTNTVVNKMLVTQKELQEKVNTLWLYSKEGFEDLADALAKKITGENK